MIFTICLEIINHIIDIGSDHLVNKTKIFFGKAIERDKGNPTKRKLRTNFLKSLFQYSVTKNVLEFLNNEKIQKLDSLSVVLDHIWSINENKLNFEHLKTYYTKASKGDNKLMKDLSIMKSSSHKSDILMLLVIFESHKNIESKGVFYSRIELLFNKLIRRVKFFFNV